jgi:hypothetical protein
VYGKSLAELAEKLLGPSGSSVECTFRKEVSKEMITVSVMVVFVLLTGRRYAHICMCVCVCPRRRSHFVDTQICPRPRQPTAQNLQSACACLLEARCAFLAILVI